MVLNIQIQLYLYFQSLPINANCEQPAETAELASAEPASPTESAQPDAPPNQGRITPLKMFSCQDCSKWFLSPEKRKAHQRNVHGKCTYTCHKCSRVFTDSQNYRKHYNRVHVGGHPFHCRICGMEFQKIRLLKKHEEQCSQQN
ncbi:hypothetical protein niasHS_004112 [Heterodera schachtii]